MTACESRTLSSTYLMSLSPGRDGDGVRVALVLNHFLAGFMTPPGRACDSRDLHLTAGDKLRARSGTHPSPTCASTPIQHRRRRSQAQTMLSRSHNPVSRLPRNVGQKLWGGQLARCHSLALMGVKADLLASPAAFLFGRLCHRQSFRRHAALSAWETRTRQTNGRRGEDRGPLGVQNRPEV